jgi:periplasmic divalent cation tolerance protein
MIVEDKGSSPASKAQEHAGETVSAAHDSAVVLIYTTFPSADEAKNAGRGLVERGLAACVNVFPQMTSIYEWEGQVTEDIEAAMIVKTVAARSAETLREIKRVHPYSVPARLVLPVIGGGGDFLNWIRTQCGTGGAGGA